MDIERWKNIKNAFAAIVDLPASERSFAIENVDSDYRDEVIQLLAGHDVDEVFIDRPIVAFAAESTNGQERVEIGRTIDGYIILERIGEGGMGTVFLAEKRGDDFTQQVALKLVKRGMDSAAVLRRFITERRLLAQLKHRNIARLIDGGSTPEGIPYFVMEYVSGRNIRDACAARSLDTRARIELFIKVCRAVSHAHQNLIVHRDIKPSNIIVTDDGEPKLLDFGIAKLIDPEQSESAESTFTRSRPLTPEYASPEQMRGDITTTATDVYSLGVVLYELLAGARPFGGERGETEPRRPSVVMSDGVASSRPGVVRRTDGAAVHETAGEPVSTNVNELRRERWHHDLDNIVLKAIRHEPSGRYASVDEFADDLRRYLDGRPVRATADSGLYRFRKFVARNRLMTGVAAAILVLSCVAAWQSVAATRARERADQRFADVRSLANAVIFDYQDGIRNLSGATAVREKMVDDGARFLDRLALDAADDPALRLELARAYERLGEVKGSFFSPSVGNAAAAKEFYSKALMIKEELLAANPENADYAAGVADTYDRVADFEFGLGNQSPAVDYYRKSVAVRETLFRRNPADRVVKLKLARGYRNIGVRGRNTVNTDESLELIDRARRLIDEMLVDEPSNPELLDARLDSREGVAAVLETNPARREEAIAGYEALIAGRRELSAKYTQNVSFRQKFGLAFSYLGDTYFELGRRTDALPQYRESVAILGPLAETDPENDQLAQDYALIAGSLAFTLAELGDDRESEELSRKVLVVLERKFEKYPDDKTTHFRIAMAREGLAIALFNRAEKPRTEARSRVENYAAALRLFESSLEIYRQYRDPEKIFPSINVDVGEAMAAVDEKIAICRRELAGAGK